MASEDKGGRNDRRIAGVIQMKPLSLYGLDKQK
ncbi:hypothetical protein HBHAL_4412 [Halobacillus halophilus DSM 2266]|uniref:Uncharacterized protein n=1 Tax=Halobacillus halophilus (strain ATCC 35676 / DSM 2266 / JCM 20832 / KCTC 3685 / LMG 17431 / NBRC 102448 / NCIMB 2269) TaxID=866895 RepID=I0JRI1_HALH3|nr:hypothetical protein HBHAL_4412 [Halobacillus halophilus DSM 2266]